MIYTNNNTIMQKPSSLRISLVTPVFNEEASLYTFHESLEKHHPLYIINKAKSYNVKDTPGGK